VAGLRKNAVDDLVADTTWFAVWRAMFLQGTVAEIGLSAWGVWCCIKAHCDFHNGLSIPSEAVIAKQTGLSERQVKRSLKILVEHNLLEKHKEWKHNVYRLREKIVLEDKDGVARAIATWTYLPAVLRKARQELQNFVLKGDTKDAKIVNIKKLELNISIVQGDQINISTPQIDLEAIKDIHLREKMAQLIQRKDQGKNIK
jgi:hypothetical protein